jgi:hypothetical protein
MQQSTTYNKVKVWLHVDSDGVFLHTESRASISYITLTISYITLTWALRSWHHEVQAREWSECLIFRYSYHVDRYQGVIQIPIRVEYPKIRESESETNSHNSGLMQ